MPWPSLRFRRFPRLRWPVKNHGLRLLQTKSRRASIQGRIWESSRGRGNASRTRKRWANIHQRTCPPKPSTSYAPDCCRSWSGPCHAAATQGSTSSARLFRFVGQSIIVQNSGAPYRHLSQRRDGEQNSKVTRNGKDTRSSGRPES